MSNLKHCKLAIVGRPNVGKSTLFNRLVGKKQAIVDNRPGVTRDYQEGDGILADMALFLTDTAGFEDGNKSLEQRMWEQTRKAIKRADVVLFLIDVREGVMPLDKKFANVLRESHRPVVLVANKCEGKAAEQRLYEAFELGMGEPVALSAEHGEGLNALYEALIPFASPDGSGNRDTQPKDCSPIQMAIVGRPNVGKSTLVNRLLGGKRMLTGSEVGITRDSVASWWSYKGRSIKLIDTAGVRKRMAVTEPIEKMAVQASIRSIKYAQVVVLLTDQNNALERQDIMIARRVINEGRILVIAVNKWDQVKDSESVRKRLTDCLERSLPQVGRIPVVYLSALTGAGVSGLLPVVFQLYDLWNRRIPTGPLNRWLGQRVEAHPPPLVAGRRIRIRYITQIKTGPPTFALFVNKADKLEEAYLRYLINNLRQDFAMPGVPIRMIPRRGKNPYV